MKPFLFVLIAILILLPTYSYSQGTVSVSGVSGDDTNSRPKDSDGHIRNDQGEYYGPEADGSYETLGAAVDTLMRFASGGTVVVGAASGGLGYATVTKPLVLTGVEGGSTVLGELTVQGTELTVTNINFAVQSGMNGSSAIRMENGKVDVSNTHFTGRGIGVYGTGETEVIVRDSVFDNASPNALTGMGGQMKVDIQNTEFKNIPAPAKCLAILPISGIAETLVKDCTFTDCYLGVDDRHSSGDAFYQNLVFRNIDWIGLNVEWGFWNGPITDAFTSITDCTFDNAQFQGVHLHGAKNVVIENVTARNCGSINARMEDGAGIGGHDGNVDIVIENCDSSDNVGSGFYFENDTNVTLRTNIALRNADGMKFVGCTDLTVENGNWIAGNEDDGIFLSQPENWKIYTSTIGLNRQRTAAMPNGDHGIYISHPRQGEIGSADNFFQRNVISGNMMNGILINGEIAGEVRIAGNLIGTDGEGLRSVPNFNGIEIQQQASAAGGRLVIGGDNPSLSGRASEVMGAGNVLSGNEWYGLYMSSQGGQLTCDVYGNYVGVDQSGLRPLPNIYGGVAVGSPNIGIIQIGSDGLAAKGNVISGNGGNGLVLREGAKYVNVRKNLIGTGVDGETEIPNEEDGILFYLEATDTLVEENVIHYNKEHGIRLNGAGVQKIRLKKNSIHRNEEEGIRLLDGANAEIKAPVFDRLFMPNRSVTEVTGQVEIPNAKIEIFTDPATADAGYWGQGKKHIRDMIADDEGIFVVDVGSIADEGTLTATVTDENNNTSEFSPILTPVVVQVVGHKGDMLVANKPTAVRIFGDTGKGTTRIATTGTLTLGEEGADVAPDEPFTISPFAYYDTRLPERKLANNSLDFLIEEPPEGRHKIEVTLRANGKERAKLETKAYRFQKTNPFTIGIVPVAAPVRIPGPTMAFPDTSLINQIGEYLGALYPVDPEKFMEGYRMLYPIGFHRPHSGADRLALYQQAEVVRILSVPPPNYAAAFVSYDTFFQSPTQGGILWGSTFGSLPTVVGTLDRWDASVPPVPNRMTLAHEIGHTAPYLLGDTYSGGGERPINPFATGANKRDNRGNYLLEEHYGFDPSGVHSYAGYASPGPIFTDLTAGSVRKFRDMMGNNFPTWNDPTNYKVLFTNMGGTVEGPSAKPLYKREEITPALLVRGTIKTDNTGTLLPLRPANSPSDRPILATLESPYSVALLDANGAVLDSQSIPVLFQEIVDGVDDSGEPFVGILPAGEIPFNAVLHDNPDAKRIELRMGETVLDAIDRSSHTPVVGGIAISDRDDLPPGSLELTWTASDEDPGETETLRYDILYTPDQGATVIPIHGDLADATSLIVYTYFLPASDEGQFIVRASDGWNLGELWSDLQVTIDNHAPTVAIVRPTQDDRLPVSRAIVLTGTGFDWDDGSLTGDKLVWTHNVDGAMLGTGTSAVVWLPLGQHTVILTATDSDGESASDDVTFQVVEDGGGVGLRRWMLH